MPIGASSGTFWDPNGKTIHNLIWPTTLTASGSMAWYWDGWIDYFNIYPVYTPLAQFMQGEDWAPQALELITSTDYCANQSGPRVYGMHGPSNAYLWVSRPGGGHVGGYELQVSWSTDAPAIVEYWNTDTGAIVLQETISPSGNQLPLAFPNFGDDIAVKAISQEALLSAY